MSDTITAVFVLSLLNERKGNEYNIAVKVREIAKVHI